MTHLADGLKSVAPSLIGVSSEEFVELKPSITTLLDFFHIIASVEGVVFSEASNTKNVPLNWLELLNLQQFG